MNRDWRLPENRREGFLRLYSFHLRYGTHPGCVYFALPAIAEAYDLDQDQRAWLAWLNGNTQNPAMSLLLLEAAPRPEDWRKAVAFWNDNFKLLDWDTDRRHQKSKFGIATEQWVNKVELSPSLDWLTAGAEGWRATWKYAFSQPYMGRLSAWSMTEYARILFGTAHIPDAEDLLLWDASGSSSHRNGLALVAGWDSTYWSWDDYSVDKVTYLEHFGEDLLAEARKRNKLNLDVGYLTMESALCTYKSMHKPNRRYPNVYADMMYYRLMKAGARFGATRFKVLWDARAQSLPEDLRLECNPEDPGLVSLKQNHYRETGEMVVIGQDYDDMLSSFDRGVILGYYGKRDS